MIGYKQLKALFSWAEKADTLRQYPELRYLVYTGRGSSPDPATPLWRYEKGVPEVFLSVGRGPFHGLWLCFQREQEKVTKAQANWMESLSRRDYACEMCSTWLDAQETIKWYLNL